MLKQHDIEIRVRYQETDPMGFLHHANYFTYFEMDGPNCCGPGAATTARSKSKACSS